MSKHCSAVIGSETHYKIKCVHCEAINHVSQSGSSSFDIEEITCWSCSKCSLIDESLLEMYPEYPNESTGACFDGKSSPDYT